jgi:hypothetical protein
MKTTFASFLARRKTEVDLVRHRMRGAWGATHRAFSSGNRRGICLSATCPQNHPMVLILRVTALALFPAGAVTTKVIAASLPFGPYATSTATDQNPKWKHLNTSTTGSANAHMGRGTAESGKPRVLLVFRQNRRRQRFWGQRALLGAIAESARAPSTSAARPKQLVSSTRRSGQLDGLQQVAGPELLHALNRAADWMGDEDSLERRAIAETRTACCEGSRRECPRWSRAATKCGGPPVLGDAQSSACCTT